MCARKVTTRETYPTLYSACICHISQVTLGSHKFNSPVRSVEPVRPVHLFSLDSQPKRPRLYYETCATSANMGALITTGAGVLMGVLVRRLPDLPFQK